MTKQTRARRAAPYGGDGARLPSEDKSTSVRAECRGKGTTHVKTSLTDHNVLKRRTLLVDRKLPYRLGKWCFALTLIVRVRSSASEPLV